MKKIIIVILLIILAKGFYAQSIVIGDGASIYVGVNADICAGSYGNISGYIYGEGTQCGQLPLPVELETFSAKIQGNEIILNWETATELNNYGFEIERKAPKTAWEEIAFIKGNGNSNSSKHYTYTDNKLAGGSKYYYRLKQLDNSGQFKYSNTIEIDMVPKQYALYQNYPNPFNPTTTINFSVPKTSFVSIKVYDILGKVIETLVNEQKEAGNYSVEFNGYKLISGIYFYTMEAGIFMETKKLILIK